MVAYIRKLLYPFCVDVEPENVHIHFYGSDKRIEWNKNNIVTLDGYGVVGYTDIDPD